MKAWCKLQMWGCLGLWSRARGAQIKALKPFAVRAAALPAAFACDSTRVHLHSKICGNAHLKRIAKRQITAHARARLAAMAAAAVAAAAPCNAALGDAGDALLLLPKGKRPRAARRTDDGITGAAGQAQWQTETQDTLVVDAAQHALHGLLQQVQLLQLQNQHLHGQLDAYEQAMQDADGAHACLLASRCALSSHAAQLQRRQQQLETTLHALPPPETWSCSMPMASWSSEQVGQGACDSLASQRSHSFGADKGSAGMASQQQPNPTYAPGASTLGKDNLRHWVEQLNLSIYVHTDQCHTFDTV